MCWQSSVSPPPTPLPWTGAAHSPCLPKDSCIGYVGPGQVLLRSQPSTMPPLPTCPNSTSSNRRVRVYSLKCLYTLISSRRSVPAAASTASAWAPPALARRRRARTSSSAPASACCRLAERGPAQCHAPCLHG
eukprot:206307-Chlamydomonas_euryale.AAC.11